MASHLLSECLKRRVHWKQQRDSLHCWVAGHQALEEMDLWEAREGTSQEEMGAGFLGGLRSEGEKWVTHREEMPDRHYISPAPSSQGSQGTCDINKASGEVGHCITHFTEVHLWRVAERSPDSQHTHTQLQPQDYIPSPEAGTESRSPDSHSVAPRITQFLSITQCSYFPSNDREAKGPNVFGYSHTAQHIVMWLCV